MPTIERTSTGMQDPSSVDTETSLRSLRDRLVAGRIIYASDINDLIALWNRFNDHYHRTDDLYGIDNYGNVGSYGGGGVYDYANEPTYRMQDNGGWNADQGYVNTNTVFSAGLHNEFAARFNSANGHGHLFDDRTG
jgi:hypothetical protein